MSVKVFFIFMFFCENMICVLTFVCVMEAYGCLWVSRDVGRMHMNAYGCIWMHMDAYQVLGPRY